MLHGYWWTIFISSFEKKIINSDIDRLFQICSPLNENGAEHFSMIVPARNVVSQFLFLVLSKCKTILFHKMITTITLEASEGKAEW